MPMEITDLREYVFALFVGRETKPDVIERDSLKYLGTGFFISKQADAITAAHVLPEPDDLGPDEHIVAISAESGKDAIFKVSQAAAYPGGDLAIFKVQGRNPSPYLEISFDERCAGTDIVAFGISDHEHYASGKELRILKGHVTLRLGGGLSEINFPVPAGMSGGPVLVGSKIVGYLVGTTRSETIDDRTEEFVEVSNTKEVIRIHESKQILHYGIFREMNSFLGHKSPIFENKDLKQLINERNVL